MVGHFNRSCVVGAAAIVAFGLNLLCSNNDNGYRMLAPYSYKVSPIPLSHISKEASGDVCDGSKPGDCFGRDTIANAVAKVVPAVVHISTPVDGHAFTVGRVCSGIIINKGGTILTCAHMFDLQRYWRSYGKVNVTLSDGRSYEGTVLNVDRPSDIAIVKIISETALPEAKIGSSIGLSPGDWVIAIGCPFNLKNTVTAGIVSRVGRKSSELGFSGVPREYLQTNCACTPENSGGPLVNMDGEVVGMNITHVRDDDELSFTLPIEFVCKIIEHFKKSRRGVQPWLGLQMLDLDEIFIAQLKKQDASFPNVSKGILVPMVTPASPGDRAGFHPDDVVIEFDGKPVESVDEVIEILGDKIGMPMMVLVKRSCDELVTLTVIPGERNLDV
ncbi:putative protease Do-like 14 [Abrus precatorius]|uniref:Protease Do-like 14 n=1 Tax=Abrus precatorius TaxID=3816 RepID=A0A8B8LDH4_ABRPR|nr:putative protease Do-like 14 [Abrus precatorius]